MAFQDLLCYGGGIFSLHTKKLDCKYYLTELKFGISNSRHRLQLHSVIYFPNSFVLMLCYCVNLKAIRYESVYLNRIVAYKLHDVIVAIDNYCYKMW